jgi:hypothetical protein
MQFNGVRPGDVPYPSLIYVRSDGEAWWIEYAAYKRSPSGTLLYDAATETFPCEMRIAPMEYDPPMWWLVEEDETAPPESLEGPLLRRL